MPNNKHLTQDNRCTIQSMLNDKASFKAIADVLDKDPSTISKEIRSHLVFRKIGGMNLHYNSCVHRFNCTKQKSSLLSLSCGTQLQALQKM